jgi:hypothetical protein
MKTGLLIVLLALGLAACGPQGRNQASAVTPAADEPPNLSEAGFPSGPS